ncbi:hypothetical protein CCPUN_02850 [Cardinium endosymbiont of Culicoides punctatus]|nr:hypothetical protein CCPUN_02850 [Cardinium endosymbiont of Culicoides punctatus]
MIKEVEATVNCIVTQILCLISQDFFEKSMIFGSLSSLYTK